MIHIVLIHINFFKFSFISSSAFSFIFLLLVKCMLEACMWPFLWWEKLLAHQRTHWTLGHLHKKAHAVVEDTYSFFICLSFSTRIHFYQISERILIHTSTKDWDISTFISGCKLHLILCDWIRFKVYLIWYQSHLYGIRVI